MGSVTEVGPELVAQLAGNVNGAALKRDRITPEEKRILTAALRQLQAKTSDVNRALQNQTGEEA